MTVGTRSGALEQDQSSTISRLTVRASSLIVVGELIKSGGSLTDKILIYGELVLYTSVGNSLAGIYQILDMWKIIIIRNCMNVV